jgi:NADPH-dependent 7-cyano-7-deazaguanine reductase QueF
MNPPERVHVKAVVDITVRRELRHLCPFKSELDEGRVEIELSSATGWTTELHSLDEYLQAWADIKISHEELTDRIAVDTRAIRVTTYWRTAGMEVVCSTSPTPARVMP